MNIKFKIPVDKQMHFLAGGMVGGIFSSKPILGTGIVIAVALGKELYDYLYNKIVRAQVHVPDANDACATFMGGIMAIVAAQFLTLII